MWCANIIVIKQLMSNSHSLIQQRTVEQTAVVQARQWKTVSGAGCRLWVDNTAYDSQRLLFWRWRFYGWSSILVETSSSFECRREPIIYATSFHWVLSAIATPSSWNASSVSLDTVSGYVWGRAPLDAWGAAIAGYPILLNPWSGTVAAKSKGKGDWRATIVVIGGSSP